MSKKNILHTLNKSGTALLMTILILNSIILISLAASKLVVSGVKMSGTQARSTKAYFAAEAGAEKVLWAFRKPGGGCVDVRESCHFSKILPNGSLYQVDDVSLATTTIFISIGTFSGIKRSVELDFNY